MLRLLVLCQAVLRASLDATGWMSQVCDLSTEPVEAVQEFKVILSIHENLSLIKQNNSTRAWDKAQLMKCLSPNLGDLSAMPRTHTENRT